MVTLKKLMDLNTLNLATWECTSQSHWKEATHRYLSNMLLNNVLLQEEVLSGKYKVSPTTNFYINERGHIRYIEAPAIRDRIIQKILSLSVLIPKLRPSLIYDNYASLENRGTSFARKRFEIMLRRYMHQNGTNGYILLIDIKKYFESIDHEVLKNLILPKLAGIPNDILQLIFYIIDSCSSTNKGLNLGSEAPQILAVYYLNNMDTYVKVVKGVKYYGRYMDDSYIIGTSKKELQTLLSEIEDVLTTLKLDINKKKTHIVKLTHGFTFLQIKYNVFPSGKILKRPSHSKITRERRRLKAFRRLLLKDQLSNRDICDCYKSWKGTLIKDHNAYHKTLNSIDALFVSMFIIKEEQKLEKESRKKISTSLYNAIDREDIPYINRLTL